LAWVQSARVNEAFFAVSVEAVVASAGVLSVAIRVGHIDRASCIGITTSGASGAVIWDAERSISVEVKEAGGARANVVVSVSGAVSVASARIGSAGVKEADFFGSFGGTFDVDGGLVVTVIASPESVALGVNIAG